jgi:hypothetical protein
MPLPDGWRVTEMKLLSLFGGTSAEEVCQEPLHQRRWTMPAPKSAVTMKFAAMEPVSTAPERRSTKKSRRLVEYAFVDPTLLSPPLPMSQPGRFGVNYCWLRWSERVPRSVSSKMSMELYAIVRTVLGVVVPGRI